MTDEETEITIDHALAQALTSAIASHSAGNPAHALYLTANIVMYVNTITGASTADFLKALQKVEDTTDFSRIGASMQEVAISDKQDEVETPRQNAPSSDSIN